MIQQEKGTDILPARLEVRCWCYTPISLFTTQGNSVISRNLPYIYTVCIICEDPAEIVIFDNKPLLFSREIPCRFITQNRIWWLGNPWELQIP